MVSKSQLAQRIAARGASHAQAGHAVDAVLGEITAALAAGERVTLLGFGSFEAVARPARTARNPRTGESVPVPAATVPRFHPGAGLKAAVDGGEVALGAVGSLADATTAAVVPSGPAKVVVPAGPTKAAKPEKSGDAEKAAKADKSVKSAKPAKEPKKEAKAKGKDAKGKKSAKKK